MAMSSGRSMPQASTTTSMTVHKISVAAVASTSPTNTLTSVAIFLRGVSRSMVMATPAMTTAAIIVAHQYRLARGVSSGSPSMGGRRMNSSATVRKSAKKPTRTMVTSRNCRRRWASMGSMVVDMAREGGPSVVGQCCWPVLRAGGVAVDRGGQS